MLFYGTGFFAIIFLLTLYLQKCAASQSNGCGTIAAAIVFATGSPGDPNSTLVQQLAMNLYLGVTPLLLLPSSTLNDRCYLEHLPWSASPGARDADYMTGI